MQKHFGAAVAVGLAVLSFAPSIAGANTVIIGTSFAASCSSKAIAGRFDTDTLEDCNQAIKNEDMTQENLAKTLVNRGVVQMRLGQLEKANADLNKAEEIAAKIPEIYINRGVILMKQKMFADAVTQLDRGIALKPDELEKAYYDRGLAREAVGDVKGAYYDFTMALKLKPNWEAPQKELVRYTVRKAG